MLDLNIITKPLTAIWQFLMTDKVCVTESTEYMPTGLWGRFNHVVYTVELPEGHVQRLPGSNTRQVHRTFDWDGGLTPAQADRSYQDMFFVLPQFADDKFLEAPKGQDIKDGKPDADIEQAIRAFDTDETNSAKKNFSNKRQPVAAGTRVRQATTRTYN